MPRTYRKSSPARSGALTVLEEVLTHGKTLLDGLPLLEPACPDPRDLALAREIVSGTCRWLGRVQYVLRHYAARLDQFPPIVQRILELSVYQLLFLDRVPPYAVLSDAVELARERKVPGLAAAVNAILRKVVQEKESHGRVDSTGLDPERFLEAEYSHPAWLVKRWREIWPEEMVDSLCRFNNTRAPLSLRAGGDVEAAWSELRRRNLPAELDSRVPGCMMIDFPGSAPAGLFDLDLWVAQDGAAMLIAPHTFVVQDHPHPEPLGDEVLVRVTHAGVCGSDVHFYETGRIGEVVLTRPFIMGHEFSGVIEIPADSSPLAAGTRVAAAVETEATAAEAYRLTRIAYEAGKSPLVELTNARRALAEARTQTIEAQLQRLRAEAGLARLQGRAPFGVS